jgi:hypothetical protein
MKKQTYTSTREVSRLLMRCLEEGKPVEIDGLGVFRPKNNGGYEFLPETRPQVFIAYVVEDSIHADRLFADLESQGFDPWMDRRKLLPGQNWPRSIERAIDNSHLFIACLSSNSVSKRGRFQAELRYALDCASLIPQDETFFIPARLDNCRVPASISGVIQYVDLFPDWSRGFSRILTMAKKQTRLRLKT